MPCATAAATPNFVPPYSVQWNLDIQQAITNNLTVDVAYVGNHGGNEQYLADLNQPALGAGWTSAAAQTATTARSPAWQARRSTTTVTSIRPLKPGRIAANFRTLTI